MLYLQHYLKKIKMKNVIAKAKLFAEKLEKEAFTIAFAGHFSAGKSSMINALVDEPILPTSPIPTSANIVTVKNTNDNYALVHFVDRATGQIFWGI